MRTTVIINDTLYKEFKQRKELFPALSSFLEEAIKSSDACLLLEEFAARLAQKIYYPSSAEVRKLRPKSLTPSEQEVRGLRERRAKNIS